MTTFQIIALSAIGVGIISAIIFFIAFIVEISKKDKEEEVVTLRDFYSKPENNEAEVVEIDINEMLAKLEENAVSEKVEEVPAQEEVIEEPAQEEVTAEFIEEEPAQEMAQEEAPIVDDVVESTVEPVEETPVEEVHEELPAKSEETQEEVQAEAETVEEPKTTVIIKKIVKEGPEFDYRIRVEKIKESEEKLEKDLEKTEKAILKYERTERRLARNQKLLDRRAGELANLNLLMYNVTDIKNIDEEKKARQEELVAHISELKASIEDAEKYLSANADKHANNIKLRDYLKGERVRYAEELNELEILIAQAEGREPVLQALEAAPVVDTDDNDDNGEANE